MIYCRHLMNPWITSLEPFIHIISTPIDNFDGLHNFVTNMSNIIQHLRKISKSLYLWLGWRLFLLIQKMDATIIIVEWCVPFFLSPFIYLWWINKEGILSSTESVLIIIFISTWSNQNVSQLTTFTHATNKGKNIFKELVLIFLIF
jgi:hypothetical protein